MNMGVPFLPADSLPALPAPRPMTLAGEPLHVMTTADGRVWATARAVADLLGYASPSSVLNLARRYAADLAGETVGIGVASTYGRRDGWTQQRHADGFSPRGVILLALVARTERGLALRARIVAAIEADHFVATSGPPANPVEAAQAVLVDAAGKVEAIKDALPDRAEEGSVLVDVVAQLDESTELLEGFRTGRLRAGAAWSVLGHVKRCATSKEFVDQGKANGFERLLGALGGKRARDDR